MILQHLDKNNLHHAYLIEGMRDEIVPEILEFLEDIGVETVGNSDFLHIKLDSFKIDDARNLKSYGNQKGFSSGKKVFIVSANSFLLEAQNSLLKMFEEPIENTHFFVIVPDANTLIPTFVSRFYLIKAASTPQGVGALTESAGDRFITMSLRDRIEFIKELLTEEDDKYEEGNEIIALNSSRSKALKFLNALELALHQKVFNQKKVQENNAQNFLAPCFEHLFKVREFLRMPGSSTKTLIESVALTVPSFSN